MRSSLAYAVLSCLVALGVATQARAATVTIEYELTGGTVGGAEFSGSVTAGKFKVTFPAAGPNTVLSGPAAVDTFSVRLFGLSISQAVEVTVQLTLLAPLMGQGAPGSAFLGGGGLLSGYSILHCLPVGPCTYYGLPASSPQLFPSFRFYPDAGNGLSIQGASGTAAGTYVTSYGYSGRVTLQFTGREIDRTFVPEPVPWLLLPVALLALGALHGVRRSRRRAA